VTPVAWTFSPKSDGNWYPCSHFKPDELVPPLVPPGTLVATPKTGEMGGREA
jgi:hypothetical protein